MADTDIEIQKEIMILSGDEFNSVTELANPMWNASHMVMMGTDPGDASTDLNTASPQIIAPLTTDDRPLRVAAYCRVSTTLSSQDTSIESQIRYYGELIETTEGWISAGVYADHGKSATGKTERPELERMLADCKMGRIDLVICKSISRFSRNVSDCLKLVRLLTGLGIHLVFEREHIDTRTGGSELLLTLLAAFAEQESRSTSQNVKWGIHKRFLDGTYRPPQSPFGYRRVHGVYEHDPNEVSAIQRIFEAALNGKGSELIAKELNTAGIPSPTGKRWRSNTVRAIIKNPAYVGNAVFQKTYVDDTFRQRINHGERDMYLMEDAYPIITDGDTVQKANEMLERHAKAYHNEPGIDRGRRNRTCFSGKLFCGLCGSVVYRGGGVFYRCYNESHGDCDMKRVYEDDVRNAFATLLNKLAYAAERMDGYVVSTGPGETDEYAGADTALVKDELDELNNRYAAGHAGAALLSEKTALEARLNDTKQSAIRHDDASDGLIRYILKRGIRDAFTEEDAHAFATYVDKAVVFSGRSVTFHFIGGYEMTESLAAEEDLMQTAS